MNSAARSRLRSGIAGVLAMSGLVVRQGCSSDTVSALEPPVAVELTKLKDTNPDPDVFEAELVASQGTKSYLPDGEADIWGYRDGAVAGSRASIPGPLLEDNDENDRRSHDNHCARWTSRLQQQHE